MTANKQQARTIVRSAAVAAKNGQITNSQFRSIAAQAMVSEIRSSFAQKSAQYNKKYMKPLKIK